MFKGMYYPGISWSGPIGVNLKGFMVIMAQSSSRPEEDFWDKTYLLASKEYMNYNSRLGYHYTSVASYLSEDPLNNHIRFMLKGGRPTTCAGPGGPVLSAWSWNAWILRWMSIKI
jgi:pyruvate,water dikinase